MYFSFPSFDLKLPVRDNAPKPQQSIWVRHISWFRWKYSLSEIGRRESFSPPLPARTELENEPLVSHPSMVRETEIENEVKQSTMVMRGESEQSVRWIGSGIWQRTGSGTACCRMKEMPVRLLSFWRSPWNCSLDRKGNTSSTRQVKKSIKFLLTEKRWTTYVFAQEGKRIIEYYIGISIKKVLHGKFGDEKRQLKKRACKF